MPTQVQWRGGNTSENNSFTGAEREITVNEDTHSLRVHDGSTAGGYELARADLSNATGITSITASGDITADGFVKSGGTSSQFLKADGSVDSNTYLTVETDTLDSVTDRGNVTTNGISVGVVTATDGNFSGIVTANSGFNIGISSSGTLVTSGPLKTLNFIGAGNTFSTDGSRVDISVAGTTNISYDTNSRTLSSSSGIGTELPLVTTTTSGLARSQDLGDWFILKCSDETTDLTAGTNKIQVRIPYAGTLTEVRASVNTAPTGSALVVDVNVNNSSVLSTKLSIDADTLTSTVSAIPVVISNSALADDDAISIDIDQVGITTAGAGLKVSLFVVRN